MDSEEEEEPENIVIDHSKTGSEEAQHIIDSYNKKLAISKRRKENAALESRIMSPARVSQLWPGLSYRELVQPTITISDDRVSNFKWGVIF